MRILIANDDGIHAPGLELLEEAAATLNADTWVVTPDREQSGMGHAITAKKPVTVNELSHQRFIVEGTPGDCVFFAIHHILPQKPDLVLSGINWGSNIGEDVTYSGTIGACMEAHLFGIPAIALSMRYEFGSNKAIEAARHFAPKIIQDLILMGLQSDFIYNVNFPNCGKDDVKGIKLAHQSKRLCSDRVKMIQAPYPTEYPWRYNIGSLADQDASSDVALIAKNYITITPLHLDLTHHAALEKLKSLKQEWS